MKCQKSPNHTGKKLSAIPSLLFPLTAFSFWAPPGLKKTGTERIFPDYNSFSWVSLPSGYSWGLRLIFLSWNHHSAKSLDSAVYLLVYLMTYASVLWFPGIHPKVRIISPMQTVLLGSLSQDDPIQLSYMGSSFGPQKAHVSFTEVWAVPNQPVYIFCLEAVLANWLRTFQIRISFWVLSVSYAKDHFSSGPLKALQTWLEMRRKHLPLYPRYTPWFGWKGTWHWLLRPLPRKSILIYSQIG